MRAYSILLPVILPHLTNLSIRWHSMVWKDAHIQALSKNKNLTVLNLSSYFEVNAQDTQHVHLRNDYAWWVRCYKRRLKATQDIASVCPRLEQCTWFQGIENPVIGTHYMRHSFIIEDRMPVMGGNVTRVVRGVKGDWMGRDYDTREGIVKCKLEDLPGDIIDKKDVVLTKIPFTTILLPGWHRKKRGF